MSASDIMLMRFFMRKGSILEQYMKIRRIAIDEMAVSGDNI